MKLDCEYYECEDGGCACGADNAQCPFEGDKDLCGEYSDYKREDKKK